MYKYRVYWYSPWRSSNLNTQFHGQPNMTPRRSPPAGVAAGNRTSTDRLKLNIAYGHLAVQWTKAFRRWEPRLQQWNMWSALSLQKKRRNTLTEYEASLSGLGSPSQYLAASEVLEGAPNVFNWHCITSALPWGTRQQVLRIYEQVRARKGRLMRISTAVTCTHSGTSSKQDSAYSAKKCVPVVPRLHSS